MDGLDWTKFQPDELEDSLMMPNGRIEMVPAGDNFLNPSQYTEKIDTLFPPWSSCYYWGSSSHINDGQILDFGLTSSASHPGPHARQILDPDQTHHLGPIVAQTTDSLESIDCLFSVSNQTDANASAEEDDISLIFSNPKPSSNDKSARPNAGPTAEARSKRKRPENSQSNIDFTHPVVNPDNNNNNNSNNSRPMSTDGTRPKRARPEKHPAMAKSASHINFQRASSSAGSSSADEPDPEAIAQLKEIIYRAAAFRPVNFGPETAERPKRRNVRISSDPQTVAARERRERISERIRVLQRLVPGGSKMDTASMLDEAANYLRFLRSQVKALEAIGRPFDRTAVVNFPVNDGNLAFFNYSFAMQQQQPQFSIQGPKSI